MHATTIDTGDPADRARTYTATGPAYLRGMPASVWRSALGARARRRALAPIA